MLPRPAGPVTHVVFDATGLKVLVKANGKSTNTPRKSAVPGVNVESEQVVCEEISLVNVGDNEVLPTMLKRWSGKSRQRCQ